MPPCSRSRPWNGRCLLLMSLGRSLEVFSCKLLVVSSLFLCANAMDGKIKRVIPSLFSALTYFAAFQFSSGPSFYPALSQSAPPRPRAMPASPLAVHSKDSSALRPRLLALQLSVTCSFSTSAQERLTFGRSASFLAHTWDLSCLVCA